MAEKGELTIFILICSEYVEFSRLHHRYDRFHRHLLVHNAGNDLRTQLQLSDPKLE